MTKSFKERLSFLEQTVNAGPVRVGDFLHIFSGKGRWILILFFTIPFCLPIQIPGLSTPFGILIACIGLRSVFGSRIWAPKSVLAKTISPRVLRKITHSAVYLTAKIEKLIHPRFEWLSTARAMQWLNALFVVFLAIVLALPLPIPLTNLAAAWSILFLALGALEDDGLFILISYFITFISIGLFGWLFQLSRSV